MKRWLVRKHISSGIDGGLDRGKTCKDKIEQPYALCVRVYYIHVKLLVVCNVPAGAVTGYLRLCWWEAVCPLSGWAWWLWLYSERSRGSAKLPHSACAYASGQLVRKNIGRFLFTRPKSKTFNHSKTRPATFLPHMVDMLKMWPSAVWKYQILFVYLSLQTMSQRASQIRWAPIYSGHKPVAWATSWQLKLL